MESLDELLELLTSPGALSALDDASLVRTVQQVEGVGRLVDALRCTVAAEVDARSEFALGGEGLASRFGHRTGSQLVEQLTRVSAGEAARRVALGGLVRPRTTLLGELLPPKRPEIARALEAGTLGTDAARAIEHCLAQAERGVATSEGLAVAESELVASALDHTADYVREEARVWRDYLDPHGVEPREDLIHAARSIRLGRERNGLTPLSGQLDQELSAMLRATFSESLAPDAKPRFRSDADRAALEECDELDGHPARGAFADPRTNEQRQHDVLLGVLTAGARSTGLGPGEMRALTTVNATITLSELLASQGMGWLDDVHEPVSAATVTMLACDSGFRVTPLDEHELPIDEGHRQRFFTARLRRALALRDGGCAWPGCMAPPAWTHAHHIVFWRNGGETNLDNGVLLCAFHHRMVHRDAWVILMVDRRPHLVAPRWLDPTAKPVPMGRGRAKRWRPPDGLLADLLPVPVEVGT